MNARSSGSQGADPLGSRITDGDGTALKRTSAEDDILHLRRSLDDAPVGLCYLDRDLRYVHINEWLAEINGLPVDAHIGRTIREVLPHLADAVETQFRTVLETGEPILAGTVEAETPASPGVKRIFEHYYYADAGADGSAVGLSCVVLDVTERVEFQRGLLRWAHIFENAEMPVVVSAPDGTIELVNPAAARMYGAPAGEFVGKHVAHLYAPEVREEVPQYSSAVNERGYASFESRHVRHDGTVFDVQVAVTAVCDEEGEVSYRVANLYDTSERKKLEAQVLHTQKTESLGILAGGIAHDFNNILAVIMGNADVALEESGQSTTARECLEEIRAASGRAAELVDQMLDYSGVGNFTAAALDLNELVRNTTESLQRMVAKSATLRIEFFASSVDFEGDAASIQQVIMNLVTNAADAIGDSEGTIVIRTGYRRLETADLVASPVAWEAAPGRHAYLEVTDTGGGMDAMTRRRIFDPFFTKKFIGRGLGLAAVLGIVRRHVGAIQVANNSGGGTTFTLYLPSDESPEYSQASDSVQEPEPVSTVLLVDDEPSVLRVTRRMLEASGHKVFSAVDGKEGLALYKERSASIDVVLLDLTMPRMGGEEVFAEIRRIRPDAQAILMTGYSQAEADDQLGNQGFAGFLRKPFTLAELSSQLENACARGESSRGGAPASSLAALQAGSRSSRRQRASRDKRGV